MKHFLALPAVLQTTIFVAAARSHTFSVGDDILAFPQFEVKFSNEEWVSEPEASAKLSQQSQSHPAQPSTTDTDLQSDSSPPDTSATPQLDYEFLTASDGQRWLCGIPRVSRPDDAGAAVNETLSRVEEEKELARATDRGWELLSAMQGNCIFFMRDWWSYSFCYNTGVRQFHQLPPSRGVPVFPPVEDPSVEGFMLGTYEEQAVDAVAAEEDKDWQDDKALEKAAHNSRRPASQGEMVVRGESRYLVQRLGGGTVCDLTGKERKIEVQFHCNPHSPDRISLIKETSTCAYLMVIQTPRLCNDVAFLPPKKDEVNTVLCKPILTDEEAEIYERELKSEKAAEEKTELDSAVEQALAELHGKPIPPPMKLIGDVYFGGHDIVPQGRRIEKSAIVGGGKETLVTSIASSDVRKLSSKDLEKLGLGDAKAVARLKKELEQIAEGQTWKLDIIDTPRGREYRAIIGEQEKEKKTKGESKAKGSENGGSDDPREGTEEEYYKEDL